MINIEYGRRAAEVKRWTIVKLTREQSVAEHHYNVWIIARGISEVLGIELHNSRDAQAIEHLALTHDLQETVTGDVPSPFKDLAPASFRALEETARNSVGLPSDAGNRGTIVEAVVKLADIAETLFFAYQNGGRDRPAVWVYVVDRFRSILKAVTKQYAHLPWERVNNLFLACSPADPAWARTLEGAYTMENAT